MGPRDLGREASGPLDQGEEPARLRDPVVEAEEHLALVVETAEPRDLGGETTKP